MAYSIFFRSRFCTIRRNLQLNGSWRKTMVFVCKLSINCINFQTEFIQNIVLINWEIYQIVSAITSNLFVIYFMIYVYMIILLTHVIRKNRLKKKAMSFHRKNDSWTMLLIASKMALMYSYLFEIYLKTQLISFG